MFLPEFGGVGKVAALHCDEPQAQQQHYLVIIHIYLNIILRPTPNINTRHHFLEVGLLSTNASSVIVDTFWLRRCIE